MSYSRYWDRRSARRRHRKEVTAGETQRQVIYTLLLAFVPFAAIVGALAASSNTQMIEALCRYVRQVDTVLDTLRDATGADADKDPDSLLRQVTWAFNNKATIEVDYVRTVDQYHHLLAWIVQSEESGEVHRIPYGEEAGAADLLARLTEEERIKAVQRGVLSFVAGKLEGLAVDDLSPEARDEAALYAKETVARRTEVFYRNFLQQGTSEWALLLADLQPVNDTPATVADVEATGTGNRKIENWIRQRKQKFLDPPDVADEVDAAVAQSFYRQEMGRLFQEFRDLRKQIDVATASTPPTPGGFLAKAQVIRQIGAAIEEQVTDESQRGPLTRLVVNQRAEALFNSAKSKMNAELLAAVPENVPTDVATQVKAILRVKPEKAHSLLENHILAICSKAAQSENLTLDQLAAFPGVKGAIGARMKELQDRLSLELGEEIEGSIDQLARSEDRLDSIFAAAPEGIIVEAANFMVEGGQIAAGTFPPLNELLTIAEETLVDSTDFQLFEKERSLLAEALSRELCQRARDAQEAAVKAVDSVQESEVASLNGLVDLTQFRADSVEALCNKAKSEILDQHPDYRGFVAAQKTAIERASQLTGVVKVRLRDNLRSELQRRIELQLPDLKQKPVTLEARRQVSQQFVTRSFPIRQPILNAEVQDLDDELRHEILAYAEQRLGGLAVAQVIHDISLPDDFNPFQDDVETVAQHLLIRDVAQKTSVQEDEIRKSHGNDVLKRAAALVKSLKASQEKTQTDTIAALTDDNLPDRLKGTTGDEKKALELLERYVLQTLKHAQLGPKAQQELQDLTEALLKSRRKTTLAEQLKVIAAVTVKTFGDNFEETVVETIVREKGDESDAVAAVRGQVTAHVQEVTNTGEILDEAREALKSKGAALVTDIRAAWYADQKIMLNRVTSDFKPPVRSGMSLEATMKFAVRTAISLAGIEESQCLPDTIAYAEEILGPNVKKSHEEIVQLDREFNKTLDGLIVADGENKGSMPDLALDEVAAQGGSGDGTTRGRTAEELRGLMSKLRPHVERKAVLEAATKALRDKLEWKPEWFCTTYPVFPRQVTTEILGILKEDDVESAETYRSEIQSLAKEEFDRILAWSKEETKQLLESPKARALFGDAIAPYEMGTSQNKPEKDPHEWYPEGSLVIDDAKVAEVTDVIVGSLVPADATSRQEHAGE